MEKVTENIHIQRKILHDNTLAQCGRNSSKVWFQNFQIKGKNCNLVVWKEYELKLFLWFQWDELGPLSPKHKHRTQHRWYWHGCGAFVYKCFLPAAIEGLEGGKGGHVICGWNYYISQISHCARYHMGPPNLKWRMGRSPDGNDSSVLFVLYPVSCWLNLFRALTITCIPATYTMTAEHLVWVGSI